jgi:dihydropteroate synthase
MGILNTTPDSFFDGGKYNAVDNALQQAEKMLNNGADILDIGGYSTRPNAKEVSVEEELKRTVPIIEQLNKQFPEAILSIDTFRAKVAKECVEAGAAIVNDISAGDDDNEMIPYVASVNVPYIIMHKQGIPETMQQNPTYGNVVKEVLQYLGNKVTELRKLGVNDIVADPGFGFGKTIEHNYSLLKHLSIFKILNVPLLAGVSRKSMINKVLGVKAAEALNGTTVLNTLALINGAKILRVHDVKEAKEAVSLVQTYQSENL